MRIYSAGVSLLVAAACGSDDSSEEASSADAGQDRAVQDVGSVADAGVDRDATPDAGSDWDSGGEQQTAPDAAVEDTWEAATDGAPEGAPDQSSNPPPIVADAEAVGPEMLTVAAWGSGTGIIRSNPVGIDCGATCTADLPGGTSVTLTATPLPGSIFAGWSGDCSGDAGCVLDMRASHRVSARFFHPVLLSDVDKSPDVVLTADRLGMENQSLASEGVRSETKIGPHSGIFYFEAERLVDAPWMTAGVVTADAPLDTSPSESGKGFDIETGDGSWFDPQQTSNYGFVVDYRGAYPIVHLLAVTWTGTAVAKSAALTTINQPLYIFVGGLRRNIGPQMAINAGNDVTNFPFFYDPVALLNQAGIAGADELVLGWGDSYAGRTDAAPQVTVGADQTVPFGSPVTVSGRASDAEDGDLTSRILWGDRATPRGARVSATGDHMTFTPDALGLHEVEATVTDSAGKTATATVRINVTGQLAQFDQVRLVPDQHSGRGVTLTPDGLGAHFTAQAKIAIRANQGLLHGFQYFEFHRELGPVNMGGGVVTGDGDLDPYGPKDVPPSCSVNVEGGTWHELMLATDFTQRFGGKNDQTYYGFAVDYRGMSPVVYIVIGDQVVDVVHMSDATVPVYPMLYAYPVNDAQTPDETINFGATAFHYDVRSILKAAGVDVTGLQVGWGGYAR